MGDVVVGVTYVVLAEFWSRHCASAGLRTVEKHVAREDKVTQRSTADCSVLYRLGCKYSALPQGLLA